MSWAVGMDGSSIYCSRMISVEGVIAFLEKGGMYSYSNGDAPPCECTVFNYVYLVYCPHNNQRPDGLCCLKNIYSTRPSLTFLTSEATTGKSPITPDCWLPQGVLVREPCIVKIYWILSDEPCMYCKHMDFSAVLESLEDCAQLRCVMCLIYSSF